MRPPRKFPATHYRPNFGNQDWFRQPYDMPQPAPKTPEAKRTQSLEQQTLLLEQQVRECQMLIAILKEENEKLKREVEHYTKFMGLKPKDGDDGNQ